LAQAAASALPATELTAQTELNASDQDPKSADRLNIGIRLSSEEAYRSALSRLLQAVGRVATKHGLAQTTLARRERALFSYSRGGYTTHFVHIHVSVTASQDRPPGSRPGGAHLAIILDDVGTDLAAADKIFALPYALTLSILPNRPHSQDIAEQARQRG